MSAARALFALQMVFALNAIGLAVWFPRIPDVKAALGLDVLTLAFCLFGMPVGTMLGFLIVGRIIRAVRAPGYLPVGRLGVPDELHRAGAGPERALALGLALFLCGLTIATDRGVDERQGQPDRAGARAGGS